MTDFGDRARSIASRFLQTALVVDDEARIEVEATVPKTVQTPDLRSFEGAATTDYSAEPDGLHSLDIRALVEAFAARGVICGVLIPRPGEDETENVSTAGRRADIVVLDWRLNGDNGEAALAMLERILSEDRDRLRLIAIYTGQQNLGEIGRTVARELRERLELEFNSVDERFVELVRLHCRIVIYAKSGSEKMAAEMRDRATREEDFPERLVLDFATMTSGLLPGIALTSLAAIRENAHRVLDRFQATLDPAFLAHSACLTAPPEAQLHMVSVLASELHSIMDDAVTSDGPGDIAAVRDWLDERRPGEQIDFKGTTVERDRVLALVEKGLEQSGGPLRKSDFRSLSSGFSGIVDDENELDRQLAWMFAFRTVYNAPLPILQLGATLRHVRCDESEEFYLCMRPKCDSVRLKVEEAFVLLPLVEPVKHTMQCVLCTEAATYRRFSIGTLPSEWEVARFVPDDKTGTVVSQRDGSQFCFEDVAGRRFDWLGELKPEFAQRVAHHLATEMSRIAINNSEWLRREER